MDTTSSQGQRRLPKWVIWSVVVLAVLIAFIAAGTVSVISLAPHAQPYLTAVERLQQNPDAISELGTPISAGFPASGHISLTDDSGDAELSFSATGPKGSGTVSFDARRDLGVWRLTRLELEVEGRDVPIDLGADAARLPRLKPLRLE